MSFSQAETKGSGRACYTAQYFHNLERNAVTILDDASVPPAIKIIFSEGPNSFEPCMGRPQLLIMVRHVAEQAPDQDKERAIGDGVATLTRTVSCSPQPNPHHKDSKTSEG